MLNKFVSVSVAVPLATGCGLIHPLPQRHITSDARYAPDLFVYLHYIPWEGNSCEERITGDFMHN